MGAGDHLCGVENLTCAQGELSYGVGFSPNRQTLLASSTKRREVSGESHEGRAASYEEPLVRRTFLRMDDSVE